MVDNGDGVGAPDDPVEKFQKMVRRVDPEATRIIRGLVHSTRRFYDPMPAGPSGPSRLPQLEKLRIATIASWLRAPFSNKDESPHFIPFDPHVHLAEARAYASAHPDHPKADVFLKMDSSSFNKLKLLTFKDGFDFQAYQQRCLELIKKAIEEKANAICFAELAYPYPGHRLAEYDSFKRFERTLQEYADVHDVIIVGGSYHCLEGQTNECAIFIPLDKHPLTRTPVDKPTNVSPRFYTKRVPAYKNGEVVRRPSSIEFPRYSAPFGQFAVLVCLDTFDPTMFLRFLAWHHDLLTSEQGQRKPYLDVIFVPSYSDNSYGWSVAKDLSYATRSIVVYVDGPFDSTRFGVAVCGESLRDSPCHRLVAAEEDYALWEIDLNQFHDEQRALKDAQEKATFWRQLAGKSQLTEVNY